MKTFISLCQYLGEYLTFDNVNGHLDDILQQETDKYIFEMYGSC